ncbi:hypothetical protein [Haloferax sp. DFSO52]|uniref:hypothetical protein n=1 Tax=Haloferax sp. DFSO52 TaxID=3388505 RepID=UPI003A84FCAE
MADFTLFEVHLHDGFEFSPSNRAPLFSKTSSTDDDYDAELESETEYDIEIETEEDETESEGGRGMSILFGFILLVGIAAAVRYIRGRGGDDELDELADLDDREEVEIDA